MRSEAHVNSISRTRVAGAPDSPEAPCIFVDRSLGELQRYRWTRDYRGWALELWDDWWDGPRPAEMQVRLDAEQAELLRAMTWLGDRVRVQGPGDDTCMVMPGPAA